MTGPGPLMAETAKASAGAGAAGSLSSWQSPRHSRWSSSSRGSGPSSPGSVITFDPDRLTARLAELESAMGRPGFWDDQQQAARISAEPSRLTRRLERYERLLGDYEDARELFSLDGDMESEIAASLDPLKRELERLQEGALFTGEDDQGAAILQLQAATGGTDAQDFTELLLRMYLRWAANRGFDTEL